MGSVALPVSCSVSVAELLSSRIQAVVFGDAAGDSDVRFVDTTHRHIRFRASDRISGCGGGGDNVAIIAV